MYWFSPITETHWTESFISWLIMTLLTTVDNISLFSWNGFDYVKNSWTKSLTFFWNLCSNGWLFLWWLSALVISRLTLGVNEAITGPHIINFSSAFALSRIPTTPPSDLISLLFYPWAWLSDRYENNRFVLFTVKNPFWNSSETVGRIRCDSLSGFK